VEKTVLKDNGAKLAEIISAMKKESKNRG